MPNSLDEAFSVNNLQRAWRWTRTNPNPLFKNYFRDVYDAYAIASEENLADLRARLTGGYYGPQRPCKCFFPKKSGILRPYTLLCIEDQITYQALANIVAERSHPKVKSRYYREVFGHLYAGKRSRYFYRKWQEGYHRFSDAVCKAHSDGLVYAASFDLTACYDSIDHGVLAKLLLGIGTDEEFNKFLVECLRTWTCASPNHELYQNHGIPQGPLPSGLMAEVILRQFDIHKRPVRRVRYFRYVDDIRLFGRTEHDLRRLLVELDLVSKSVGLFPQTSKIDIHRVTDVNKEIKSISNPPEPGVGVAYPEQKFVKKRLTELSRRYKVKDETRFKWVLSQASPSLPLSRRLLRIIRGYPHLYLSISRYLVRHDTMSAEIAESILAYLRDENLYTAVAAALLNATRGRVPHGLLPDYITFARKQYRKRDRLPGHAELRAAAVAWLLETRQLPYTATRSAIKVSSEWWVRKALLKHVDRQFMGEPSYAALLNDAMKDQSVDVAVVAAHALATSEVSLASPRTGTNRLAELLLKEFEIIGRVSGRPCGVDASLTEMLVRHPCRRSWRTILGSRYDHAVRIVVGAKGYAQTNPSAWANVMDTFHDVLLEAVFAHDPTIGSYVGFGSALNSRSRFAKKFPGLYAAVHRVHEMRRQSHLSHPRVKKTGKPTERLKFRHVSLAKPILLRGYAELDSNW